MTHRISGPAQVLRLALQKIAMIVVALLASGTFLFADETKVLYSWEFDSQDDVKSWGRNCITQPVVENSALCGVFTDWDPFIVSPQIHVEPKTGQFLEIRMKSTGLLDTTENSIRIKS